MKKIREEVVGKSIKIIGKNPLGYPYGIYKGMKVNFDNNEDMPSGLMVKAGAFRMEGKWPSGIYVYEASIDKE